MTQPYCALACAQRTHHPTPQRLAQSIARKRKQPKCPSNDEWIMENWYICTVEFWSAVRRHEIMTVQVSGRK